MTIVTHEPCGCIRTEKPGYVHTKLCIEHSAIAFAKWNDPKGAGVVATFSPPASDNSDLL